MRLCEFATSSSKGTCGKELFAWARYKRGDVPESGDCKRGLNTIVR